MSQGKKRRRRWQAEDKLRIVLAGLEPGAGPQAKSTAKQSDQLSTSFHGLVAEPGDFDHIKAKGSELSELIEFKDSIEGELD